MIWAKKLQGGHKYFRATRELYAPLDKNSVYAPGGSQGGWGEGGMRPRVRNAHLIIKNY